MKSRRSSLENLNIAKLAPHLIDYECKMVILKFSHGSAIETL